MIRKESIAVINDSLSQPPLSDVVLSAVAAHVESHLRSVLKTAEKFSRHSFQSQLLPDHLNSALRVMGQPPVYGHAQGVLGPGGGGGTGGEAVWKDAGGGVYYAEDEMLDFASVLSASLPPPPAAASLSVHWLAVEGVQPAVPQNPKAAQHDASSHSATHTPADSSRHAHVVLTVASAVSVLCSTACGDEADRRAAAAANCRLSCSRRAASDRRQHSKDCSASTSTIA